MSEPIRSRPYSTAMACEACIFGRGEHAVWCLEIFKSPGISEFIEACAVLAEERLKWSAAQ